MPSATLNEIENEFAQLSPEAQFGLLERLQRRVRVSQVGGKDTWEDQLSAMAASPQVRREIDCFNADTSITEADGLSRIRAVKKWERDPLDRFRSASRRPARTLVAEVKGKK